MAVKTKSIFQPAENEDGYRILITRYYPRGISRDHFHEWVMALSPNQKLLFEYKEGKIGWEAFKQQFVAQLRNDMDCLEAIHALHSMSGSEDVTLLCYEKSGNPCHRHLVRDIVENPNLLTPQP